MHNHNSTPSLPNRTADASSGSQAASTHSQTDSIPGSIPSTLIGIASIPQKACYSPHCQQIKHYSIFEGLFCIFRSHLDPLPLLFSRANRSHWEPMSLHCSCRREYHIGEFREFEANMTCWSGILGIETVAYRNQGSHSRFSCPRWQ